MCGKKNCITEEQEEVLEDFWNMIEDSGKTPTPGVFMDAEVLKGVSGITEMVKKGYLEKRENALFLTESGYERARDLVRHHRLAERLLADVLNLEEDEFEKTACRYEHLLEQDAAESVCILLGHPRTCPHGKFIPAGECCQAGETRLRPLVVPLVELETGETGRIAYIGTKDNSRLSYLTSLGIITNNQIHLVQKRPSYILKIDETTVAIDESVGKEIFVRPSQKKRPVSSGTSILWKIFGRKA